MQTGKLLLAKICPDRHGAVLVKNAARLLQSRLRKVRVVDFKAEQLAPHVLINLRAPLRSVAGYLHVGSLTLQELSEELANTSLA